MSSDRLSVAPKNVERHILAIDDEASILDLLTEYLRAIGMPMPVWSPAPGVVMFDEDEGIAETFRNKYLAFTVDEYQDVNLLQETLLRSWLGQRDELCVVGDDYQSIYGFTGATPKYLIEMPGRFPRTTVVRLESNYRSTPQVVGLANRVLAGAKL